MVRLGSGFGFGFSGFGFRMMALEGRISRALFW